MVRWVLLLAGVGWGISIWFVLVPWKVALAGLVEMGAVPIRYDPFLNYWMRVVGLVFGVIGFGCFLFALRLEKYSVMVPLVGSFHLLVGMGSFVIAMSMGMSVKVYPTLVAEIVFSVVVGLSILGFWEGEGLQEIEPTHRQR